jgi:hypothetical protein
MLNSVTIIKVSFWQTSITNSAVKTTTDYLKISAIFDNLNQLNLSRFIAPSMYTVLIANLSSNSVPKNWKPGSRNGKKKWPLAGDLNARYIKVLL